MYLGKVVETRYFVLCVDKGLNNPPKQTNASSSLIQDEHKYMVF